VPLKPNVLDRLLLSKSFLDRIRFQPVAVNDRHGLASSIIASHDAAELAMAAVADEIGCSPANTGKAYLMDYFDPIEKKTGTVAYGKDYAPQLNAVRTQVKHQGLFPDARQWSRVAETVYQHVSKWCQDYLKISFEDLDESALLTYQDVKGLYEEAKTCRDSGDFKTALEKISIALSIVFERNSALRGLTAGDSRSDDAIRLSGFGVHANDFLALQEFLPHVESRGTSAGLPQWKQSQFGHPGNWTEASVEFCLRTFVDVAIKIQDAHWVPGAIDRGVLYDQQIEALRDDVEIWTEVVEGSMFSGLAATVMGGQSRREVLKTLKKGELLRASVSIAAEASGDSAKDALYGGGVKTGRVLSVWIFAQNPRNTLFGKVLASDVKVICVPKEDKFIGEYFPNLRAIEWEPE
jgi:hypothetical protein